MDEGSLILPAERRTKRAATAGSRSSVTTNSRKPFVKVFEAAFGNSKGRGAPAAGIWAASFTPGGTIPEAFWGGRSLASDCPREGAGAVAVSCAITVVAKTKDIASSNQREFQTQLERFILTPRILA